MEQSALIALLWQGLGETMYMTLLSTLLAFVCGLPLGILLILSRENGLRPRPFLYRVLDIVINSSRSIPFLILLVAVLPLTRRLVGSSIGSTATIPPLVIAATPFVARLVEAALVEVDSGLLEAARAMGASNSQVVWKVLLPEARIGLLNAAVLATTTILGYSALAGFTGGGGLGAIAVNYGYHRYQTDIMLYTILLLILTVQFLQSCGEALAQKLDHQKALPRARS